MGGNQYSLEYFRLTALYYSSLSAIAEDLIQWNAEPRKLCEDLDAEAV